MEMDRCRDLREHFTAFVVGSIDKSMELRVELHLSDGCATCAAELEGLQHAFQAVPVASAPQPLGAGSAALLTKNIAAQPQELPEPPIVYPETDERRLLMWMVFLLVIALGAAGFWGRAQLQRLRQAESEAASERSQTRRVIEDYRNLQERTQETEALLTALTSPEVSSHDFPATAAGARLRAFVNLEAGSITLSFGALPTEGALGIDWIEGESTVRLGLLEERIARTGGGQTFALPDGAALPARLRIVDGAGAPVIEGELVAGLPYATPPEPTP